MSDEYDPEIRDSSEYDRIHSVKPYPPRPGDWLENHRCDECGGWLVKASVTYRTILVCNDCETTDEVLYAR
jgi:formylmethanofuran dehydrogenase subunit E